MNLYRLALQPSVLYPTPLSHELLDGRLPERACIQSLTAQPWGHELEVGHEGASEAHEHVEVLDQLLVGAEELGYTFARGQIVKVTDRAIEMAVRGGLGALGIGSTSKNVEVAGLVGVAGWVGGLFLGSQMEKVEPIFQVQLTNRGWLLTPVAKPAAHGRVAVQAT